MEEIHKFLPQTKLIIEVLFPGEFRIGWEYEGVKYLPGSGSYYDLVTALNQAWQAFCREFPDKGIDNAVLETAQQSEQADEAVCPAHQAYFEEDGTCAIAGCKETRPAGNANR